MCLVRIMLHAFSVGPSNIRCVSFPQLTPHLSWPFPTFLSQSGPLGYKHSQQRKKNIPRTSGNCLFSDGAQQQTRSMNLPFVKNFLKQKANELIQLEKPQCQADINSGSHCSLLRCNVKRKKKRSQPYNEQKWII